ncbi:MAG: PorP/SprF family type IX secretion system membrane protein [Lewinellaceae bacterium]|nr:PorP/SprF family type IX secretion system membrane protein [Phaeodactylibacter sp.]MCB9039069.1 PorP/SprF family type IX secretion system membrane protein [Lewinellaceae bacterium]
METKLNAHSRRIIWQSLISLSAVFILPAAVSAQQLAHYLPGSGVLFQHNPAMAGRWDYLEFGAVFRQQWLDFQDAPRSAFAYFEYPWLDKNISFGGHLLHDQAGLFTQNTASLSYAYRFQPGLVHTYDQLAVGIQGTFYQSRLDGSRATFNDLNDPLIVNSRVSNMTVNFGAGLYYASTSESRQEDESFFYVGLGANQLIPQQHLFSEEEKSLAITQKIHTNAIIGGRLNNNDYFLEPFLWVDYLPPSVFLMTMGFRLEIYQAFFSELRVSTNGTVGGLVGIILKNGVLRDGFLRIGVGSNHNLTSAGGIRGPGLEFNLAYRFHFQ